MTKETQKQKDIRLDAFYLLGKYQAFSSMMLHELKDTANYDTNKQFFNDLKDELDRLCKGEKIR